jgi:hypothetical protein
LQDAPDNPTPATLNADAFRTAIVGRQVAVDFGRSRRSTEGESVAVSRRLLLDHDALARLITALREVLGRNATKWQALAEQGRPEAVQAPSPSHAMPVEAGDKAGLLVRLVGALQCPHYHERSIRISEGMLAMNRFLLTVNTRSIPGDVRQGIVGICKGIGMPPEYLREVEDGLAGAKAVHFGFEGDERILYKVYLERRDAYDESESAAAGTPVLMHVAFKWDSNDPGHRAVSRYHWYPHLPAAQVLDRMAAIYGGDRESPSFRIAGGVLALAATGMNIKGLQYLEVKEDGNPRHSFDLNVYNAGLQLRELQAQFSQMRERFNLRPGHFQVVYDQIKSQVFGHLAGGVHRNGKDFFNVYYGVQRYRG